MHKYYLSLDHRATGENEVHREDCAINVAQKRRVRLGNHVNCKSAVDQAEYDYFFLLVDGCKACCPECHKG